MKKLYTVVWSKESLDELAAFYVAADDPPAVSRASDQIDDLLGSSPTAHGVHLREGLWKLNVDPLLAMFVIEEADKMVRVWTIRLFDEPPRSDDPTHNND